MDEDSDDLVVYHAIIKYLKIISSVFWSFPLSSSIAKYLNGETTFTASKLEIYVSLFAVASLFFLLLYHSCSFIQGLFRRIFKSKIRKVLLIDSVDLLGGDRDTWELVKDDCCVYALKGRRPKMEDRFSVIYDKETGISLYGVFDGHGGEFAAEFVEKHLFKVLLKKLQTAIKEVTVKKDLTGEFVQLLTKEILSVDLELLVKVKAAKDVAGTTALVAIVYKNELIVANVGDSRGVICDSKGNTIPLSFDHKPDQLKERRRIKEAGGFIAFHGVWRVAGILATSRALGDFPLKDRNLVIARPDILTFDLADLRPQFMIMATDGLWDTFTNEDAVAFIKSLDQREKNKRAKKLALQAHKNGSMDNITVMVVNINNEKS